MSSPEKRPRGRPPTYTDEEKIQRKRELARVRQARKRERDRVRRWSTGQDSEEMGSQGISSPPENSVDGTNTNGLSQKASQSAWGLEKAVGFQVQVRGTRDNTPSDQEYPTPSDEGIMSRQHNLPSRLVALPSPQPSALPLPSIPDDPMVSDEPESYDRAHEENLAIWHKIHSISRALEASRGSRVMRNQLTSLLYTNELVSLIQAWEEAGFMSREKASLPPPPPMAEQQTGIPTPLPSTSSRGSVFPGGVSNGRQEETEDELMERILDNLSGRMQALKRRKSLKAEVDELRKALLEKEAKLKECNAILEAERAVWHNFQNMQV
ncbi:hypothetical protein L873DRAFT_1829629 [Choiromyces venosus 120613-1]|uniref:Uncharacterized protein n=1 Tax=Choiromyces venosus 120613-1 TaxID=1336337 RepID=A0A3N4JCL6_9PEZI|nr:hypothetical protein L873DRAFT_1829629 [Choiromyces venosus 120613-1]